jgi:hypothetical protein
MISEFDEMLTEMSDLLTKSFTNLKSFIKEPLHDKSGGPLDQNMQAENLP